MKKERERMHICITENRKSYSALHSGQKITHRKYGRGIIVGFDSWTGNPMAFFYNPNMQIKHGNKAAAILEEDVSFF